MKNNDWEQELHLYRLDPAPPRKATFQDYIAPYFTDGDITHFFEFLHNYEPVLNKRVMGWVANYEMRGHFPFQHRPPHSRTITGIIKTSRCRI